jgi:hypothetical protein
MVRRAGLVLYFSLTSDIDDTIYDRLFTPGDVLGLDHIDESGKPRVAGTPKPLTIK